MKLKLLSAMLLGAALCAQADGYKDGIEYYKADQFENAKEILEKNLNAPQTDKAISYYYLGQIALKNGDKAAAKANFDKGIAANANCPYNYVGLGALDLLAGNKSAAEDNFKKAKDLEKKNYEVQAYIARAYYNADPVAYAKDIDKIIAKIKKDGKDEPAVYILEGDMAMDSDNPGEAAAKYETAVYYEVDNPEGYVKYANAYFRVNPDYAVQKLEELLKNNPTSALAQRELAEKYYENGQWLKASDMYGQYIQNPNHFPQDKERYSVLLYYGEKYPQSLQVANELMAQKPDGFLINRMRMLNLDKLARYEEAVAAGDKFFTLNGYFTGNDYLTYANALKNVGRADEAVAQVKMAFEKDPTNENLMKELSNTYNAAEQYGDAAQVYAEFINAKENPDVNDYFALAGRYLNAISHDSVDAVRAANTAEGLKYIGKALEMKPDNTQLMMRKAQIVLAGNKNTPSNEFAEICQNILSVLDADPANMDAANPNNERNTYKTVYQFMGIYELNANKNQDKAIEYFGKQYDIDPAGCPAAIREIVEKARNK